MSDGVVAGRLEVPVTSDTTGFAKELKRKIDAAAKGIAAKVGVEIEEKGLRAKLDEAVQTAAAGVKAKVEVQFSKTQVKAALKEATAGVKDGVDVKVGLKGSIKDDVEKEAEEGQAVARSRPIEFLAKLKENGLIAKVRALRAAAQAEADKGGKGGDGGSSKAFDGLGDAFGKVMAYGPVAFLKGLGGALLKFSAIGSLVSPVISVVGSSLGGAFAMIGNLGTMVQTLALAPGVLTGVGLGLGAIVLAMTGWDKTASPAMLRAKRILKGLAPEWKKVAEVVRENFWAKAVDYIKPISDSVLPGLRDGLGQTATKLGEVVQKWGEWAQQPDTQSQWNGLMQRGAETAGALADALQGTAQWALNLSTAAGPLQDAFNEGIRDFGDWMRGLLDTKAERDALAEDLEYAGEKAKQAGRLLQEGFGGLKGLFRAGREAGDELLGKFEELLTNFHAFADSPEGQTKLKDWFDQAGKIAESVGGLFKDLTKAVLDLAVDPGTVDLIDRLRGAIPPLKDALVALANSGIPGKLIDLAVAAADLIKTIAENNGGAEFVLGLLIGGLTGIADFFAEHPNLTSGISGLAVAVAALAAAGALLSALKVTNIVGALAQAAGFALPGGKGKDNGTPGGSKPGNFLKDLFGKRIEVHWTTPMPVTVLGAGGGTGSGTTVVDGPDGDGKKKPKGKPGKLGGADGRSFGTYIGGASGMEGTWGDTGPVDGGKTKPKGKFGKLGAGVRKIGGGIGGATRKVGGALGKGGKALPGLARYGAAAGSLWLGTSGAAMGTPMMSGFAGGSVGDPSVQYAGFDEPARTKKTKGLPKTKSIGGGAKGAASLGKGPGGIIGSLFGKGAATKISGALASGGKKAGGLLGKVGSLGMKAVKGGGLVGLAAGIAGDAIGNKVNDGNGGVRQAAGGAIKGATAGAGIGATIGSFVMPGVGTAVGGVAGGLVGGGIGLAKSGADWSKVAEEAKAQFEGMKLAASVGASVVSGKWDELKTATATKFTELSEGAKNKVTELKDGAVAKAGELASGAAERFESLRAGAAEKLEGARAAVAEKAEGLRSAAVEKITGAKDAVVAKAGELKDGAVAKFSEFKDGASTKLSETKTAAETKAREIKDGVVTKVGELRSGAASKWDDFKTGATEKLQSAKQAAQDKAGEIKTGVVDKIKEISSGLSGIDLGAAGKAVIGSFKRGLESIYGSVQQSLQSFTQRIKDWKGPMSLDRVLLTPAGEAVMGGFQKGLEGQYGAIRQSLTGFTSDLGATQVDPLAAMRARSGGSRFGLTAAAAPQQTVTFAEGSIQVTNPTPEPASTSVAGNLRRVGTFGLFG